MNDTPHHLNHAEFWAEMLGALEAPCAACSGTGKRSTPQWQQWNEELERRLEAARKARQAAGLPVDRWVTGLGTVVGIHDNRDQQKVTEPPAELLAAENAITAHEKNAPGSADREVTCEQCAGRRLVASELGEQFLALLERHGFLRMNRPLPPLPDPPRRPPHEAYGQAEQRTGTTG
ncbi:hypothetical protein ABZ897_43355 [Nonomuraea sp. NPDC046802]|uniref:hypothetical protein n=1 Tax=Nonomuraea sp. NPDC046802 TaxID=3154919 RepID=UPI0033CB83B9